MHSPHIVRYRSATTAKERLVRGNLLLPSTFPGVVCCTTPRMLAVRAAAAGQRCSGEVRCLQHDKTGEKMPEPSHGFVGCTGTTFPACEMWQVCLYCYCCAYRTTLEPLTTPALNQAGIERQACHAPAHPKVTHSLTAATTWEMRSSYCLSVSLYSCFLSGLFFSRKMPTVERYFTTTSRRLRIWIPLYARPVSMEGTFPEARVRREVR